MDRILDRRAIKTGIKNGDGFTKFQEKFGLDKEALGKEIHRLYKQNQDTADDLIKDIATNEKKFLKASKKKPVTEYKGVPIEDFMNMSMDEFMGIENGKTDEEETPKISREVVLGSEIRQLEDEIAKCESERKQWLSRQHDSLKQMSELEEKLTKLKDDLVRLKEKYNCVAERNNKIIARANEFLERKHELGAALEEKRQELEKLSRIAVGVYADGAVSLMEPDATDIKLNDDGWEVHFANLSNPHRTECQDLKMREITAISKMLAIIENDGGAHGFEIAFDNSEMEAAYDTINATPR